MIICEKDKKMSISVLGYEFPGIPVRKEDSFDHDANWLTIGLKYEKGGEEEKHGAFILTTELSKLIESLCKMTEKDSGVYASNFLESNFSLFAMKVDGQYNFAAQFKYDEKCEWHTLEVCAKLSDEEFGGIVDELKEAYAKYPER